MPAGPAAWAHDVAQVPRAGEDRVTVDVNAEKL